MEPTSNPSAETWYAKSRWLSSAELLLGVFFVIGYNVLHIVPNEVPILFVIGMISLRLRSGGWRELGFRRPDSWIRVILFALAAAALRLLMGEFVIEL